MFFKRNWTGWKYIVDRYKSIAGPVQRETKEGRPRVEIREDRRILEICAALSTAGRWLKRLDLVYETVVKKKRSSTTNPILNLTEIAGP
jgi:hypothetical protein